jgi:hypothetical protein
MIYDAETIAAMEKLLALKKADPEAFKKAVKERKKVETQFKCVVCGKITAGRVPREGHVEGDLSARFPRRHKGIDGKPCEGNIEEAEWVNVPIK